jgi:RNA recognition motif-containing protein
MPENTMTTRLHVGNIPRTVTADDLDAIFRQFGAVELIQIATDPKSGLSSGCGVVEMSFDSDAQNAIDRLNFSQYAGHTIGVSRARTE